MFVDMHMPANPVSSTKMKIIASELCYCWLRYYVVNLEHMHSYALSINYQICNTSTHFRTHNIYSSACH